MSLKAPKYDARAGQVIAGNLARGGDGKFTRADGSAASGREVINALTKKPKGGKGGGKRASDAQQDATAQKIGLQAGDAKALANFGKGGQMDDATAARLEKAGMVERGANGDLRFTGAGRSATRALQRGDERGASDAASRARDAQSKREERQAKRDQAAADRAARAGQRDGKRQSRENARAQAQSQVSAGEREKIGNRLEEIESLADQRGEDMSDFQRTQAVNRLEELQTRLTKAGGDDTLSKRIDAMRRKLTGEDAPEAPANHPQGVASPTPIKEAKGGRFEVFKAGDSYRWLAVTTNAFKDGDGEIVATDALEADAERMTTENDFGPLRWWHVGNVEYPRALDWTSAKAGRGIDIGTTDYATVIGRMRIEGGTIHKEFGEAIAAEPNAYALSIGFAHPISEPQAGVFHNIRTFERSLLPRGRAANPFTSIQIQQESDMASMKEKLQGLADRFFGGDLAKAEAIAGEVMAQGKELETAGVAFKSGDATDEAKADDAPLAEVKADAPADMAEGETPEADDTGDPATFVGDMTPDEFAKLIAGAIAEAIAPLMGQMNEAKQAAQAVQAELGTTKEASGKTAGNVAALEARVKELEGDAPSAKGFRASQSIETLKQAPPAPPQAEDDIARLAAWVLTKAQ